MRTREKLRQEKFPDIPDARKLFRQYRRYNANPIKCRWNNNGCLIALANKRKNYHDISRDGKKWLLHRWVFYINNGFLPEEVMHTCDNEHCINPLHLVPGNRALNELDKKNKGRTLKGIRNPMAKLTYNDVINLRSEISTRKREVKTICQDYGISLATYYKIKNRETWKDD